MNREIRPLIIEREVNNQDSTLFSLWVRNKKEKENNETSDYLQLVLNLISNTEEILIIYGKLIIHPTIKIALEDLSQNIRLYILVGDLQDHRDIFKNIKGIIREHPSANSTFLLSDPHKNSRGFWLSNDLTSSSIKNSVKIDLVAEQIIGLWKHFSYLFWQSEGKELFYGKYRDPQSRIPKIGEISAKINDCFRTSEALENILEHCELDDIWCNTDFPSQLSHFLLSNITLTVDLNEILKDMIEVDLIENLYATSNLPFTLIQGHDFDENPLYFIFKTDIGLFLTKSQWVQIQSQLPMREFIYHSAIQIRDLNSEFFPYSKNWDKFNDQLRQIDNQERVKVQSINSKDINEFLEWKEKDPLDLKYPDKLPYSRQIKYQWDIYPPYLSKTARKHRYYGIWKNYQDEIGNYINTLIEEINKALEIEEDRKNKRLLIINKGIWTDLLKDLQDFKTIEWLAIDYYDAEDQYKKLRNISQQFSKSLNDLEQKQTKKKNSKNEDSELDVFLKKNKKRIKASNLQNIPEFPDKPLPKTGLLYENNKKTQNYLVISTYDEIEPAKEIASTYHAKIKVKR